MTPSHIAFNKGASKPFLNIGQENSLIFRKYSVLSVIARNLARDRCSFEHEGAGFICQALNNQKDNILKF